MQTDVNEVIANFNEEKYVAEGSVKNSIDSKKKEIQALTRAYSLERDGYQNEKKVGKEFEKQYGMSVSEIQIVAAESTAEVKSAKRYSICCCDVKRKERSKNDAIETVKPVEINTKEPPKK